MIGWITATLWASVSVLTALQHNDPWLFAAATAGVVVSAIAAVAA